MTRMIRKTAAVLACAMAPAFATAAYADDAGGPYVGVSAGYDWTKADAKTTTVFSPTGYFAQTSVDSINANGAQRIKPRSFIGGIDAGYDIKSGGVLFGIAADVSIVNKSKTASTTVTYPCCSPSAYTLSQTVKTTWMTTVRAKLGIDVGSASIYATGGWAGARLKYGASFTDTFATAHESASGAKFKSGWVAGAGADIPLGGGWTLTPEFVHASFGRLDVAGGTLTAFTPATSFPTNTFTHSVKVKMDIARVGLHYHF